MAVRDDPMSGEDVTVKVYRWAEKEVASGLINGANSDYIVDNTMVELLQLKGTPTSDYVASSTSFAIRDIAVYFRLNGVDTRVDESRVTATGTTVTISAAPETTDADNIVISYAYTDTNDGVTDYTYYVKDYEVNFGDRDLTEVKVLGGRSYKRRESQGLTECSLTTIKKDVLLSQLLNGDLVRTTAEVSSVLIKSTVGGSASIGRCLVITHTDPDNSDDRLITILRNVKGATCSFSGGADAELEETITVKANPQDSGDLEITEQ